MSSVYVIRRRPAARRERTPEPFTIATEKHDTPRGVDRERERLAEICGEMSHYGARVSPLDVRRARR